MPFAPATKFKLKARIALEGPPGSGKTYSALAIATALAGPKGRIALIDSEGRRSELNSHLFRFDVQHITNNHPRNWARMIEEANQHDVLICDSFSQEWNGRGGCLELVDEAAKQFNGNSYFAWGTVTPMHNEIIQLLLNHPAHVICTIRTKVEHVIEQVDGKSVPRVLGLAPIQRETTDYEFDVIGRLDTNHRLTVIKAWDSLQDEVFLKPGQAFAEVLLEYLNLGADPAPRVGIEPVNTLVNRVRWLRDAERNSPMGNPPQFAWRMGQPAQPLRDEIKASRARIVDYLLDVAGGAFDRKKLSAMDDDDLVMVLKASAITTDS